MPLMPFPYVDSATIKNDSIELAVEVDPNDSGTYVEVSGSATQTGGAFANFYDIRPVPAAPNDPDDPTSTKRYVFVSAHAIPPNKFREDQDVTVVIRVGKVWLTVLGKGPATSEAEGTQSGNGTKWDQVRRVSEITGDPPDLTGNSQTAGSGH